MFLWQCLLIQPTELFTENWACNSSCTSKNCPPPWTLVPWIVLRLFVKAENSVIKEKWEFYLLCEFFNILIMWLCCLYFTNSSSSESHMMKWLCLVISIIFVHENMLTVFPVERKKTFYYQSCYFDVKFLFHRVKNELSVV